MSRRNPRAIDPEAEEKSPYFLTYLPIFLDYLTVEKGLAVNSLKSYAIDLRHFGHHLQEKKIDLEGVTRADLIHCEKGQLNGRSSA